MDKSVKIEISIPYYDEKLERYVRKGEKLNISKARALEMINAERKENVEVFNFISIKKGEL